MNKKENLQKRKTKKIRVLYSTRVKTENGGSMRRSYYAQYPRISMEGEWLEKLGFHIGDRLKVEYGDGSINICLAETGMQPAMLCEDTGEYGAGESKNSARKSSGGKEA